MSRTCANCGRTLPTEQLEPGRARCANRAECRTLTAARIADWNVPKGVAAGTYEKPKPLKRARRASRIPPP